MLKLYKIVALKQSEGTGPESFTFIIKGNNQNEAYSNALNHIHNELLVQADYHMEISLIDKSLL